jgi:lipopolysaccharide export system permease protein
VTGLVATSEPLLSPPLVGRRFASWTVGRYVASVTLAGIGAALALLAVAAALVDAVEQLRKTGQKPGLDMADALAMSACRWPMLVVELLPFAALGGAMLAFDRLRRRHELTALRAAGVSIWQMLGPAVGAAGLLGVLAVGLLDPLAAAMHARYERLQQHVAPADDRPALAGGGVWLREETGAERRLVHARTVDGAGLRLADVIVLRYREGGRYAGRIDAASARLLDGEWLLEAPVSTLPNGETSRASSMHLPTRLIPARLLEGGRPPAMLPLWRLPAEIAELAAVGLATRSHELRWHGLLARPFLLAAMLLIGAVSALRLPRLGGTGTVLAAGLAAGFLFHLGQSLVGAMGLAGRLPVGLAAWAPVLIVGLLGIAALLRLEDG